jgi:ferritin-like metal-binding protein YciE
MKQSEQKILQYLDAAHTSEVGLVRNLQEQIMMTPRGSYRSALESHLRETRKHASRLEARMDELGRGSDPLQRLLGFAEGAVGQMLALGKAPLDLARGSGGEEKVLENAKDACAAEALEIATYTALEQLASAVEDDATAQLAASIRSEEERMLARVLREIPKLTEAVVRVDIDGESSYGLGETGAADVVRDIGTAARRRARKAESQAKETVREVEVQARDAAGSVESQVRRAARGARKVPGVASAEGQLKGAMASEGDLAIADYDTLTASEIVEKLPGLSQIDLAKVDAYERRHQDRSTVLAKLSTLRAEEPWPGYDELNASQIHEVLGEGDERLAKAVHSYERSHKGRSGVLADAERERARA